MALSNYTDLQASIAAWLHRTDLSTVIPDFITLAESRMTRDLPDRALFAAATITTVAGTEGYSIPVSVIKLSRVWMTDQAGIISALPQVNSSSDRTSIQGRPLAYSIDSNQIRLSPVPDGVYTITIDHKKSIPALITNSTNEVLTKYPDLYLNACLVEACEYTADRAKLEVFEGRYQDCLRGAIDNANHNRLAVLITDLPTRGGGFNIITGA